VVDSATVSKDSYDEAIEQEREIEASPDVEPVEEDEDLEDEEENEKEDRESDEIEEREEGIASEGDVQRAP